MQLIIDIVGALLIVCAGAFAGNAAVSLLGRKSKILNDIKTMIGSIHSGFFYRNFDVITAFNEAGKTPRAVLDLDITNLEETNFKQELLHRITTSSTINLLLGDNQRQMLREALLLIGSGSLNEECDRLKYFIEYFDDELKKAAEYEQKNKKLFLAMSVYVSVIIAVVLI